jgi:RNA-directed DNA polymerase
MERNYEEIPWCRYADDGLVHCKTKQEAEQLLKNLVRRFKECGLELHPDKTKIVYCKDWKRRGNYVKTEFDFLGYNFRSRKVKNKNDGKIFVGFVPMASKTALKAMRDRIRKSCVRKRTDMSFEDISKIFNPVLRGWINYYGRFYGSGMYAVLNHFNQTLVTWADESIRSSVDIKQELENLWSDWRHEIRDRLYIGR